MEKEHLRKVEEKRLLEERNKPMPEVTLMDDAELEKIASGASTIELAEKIQAMNKIINANQALARQEAE
jgi:hypothetical protein